MFSSVTEGRIHPFPSVSKRRGILYEKRRVMRAGRDSALRTRRLAVLVRLRSELTVRIIDRRSFFIASFDGGEVGTIDRYVQGACYRDFIAAV